ncbi:MAG: hypothetical protein ACOX7F_05650 [Eubacteriales bacterium]
MKEKIIRKWIARAPLFFLLWGFIAVRYCYYGFHYFPQLDDYIQYHNYAAYHPDLWGLIEQLGLLAARPLAGLMDLFVWSPLFQEMIVGVWLIALLHAASAMLFRRVWARYFGTGTLFLVLYALLPLGMEGTYWMSASTRVVCSLFFVSLSMACFQYWCQQGRKRWLVAYVIAQLLSYGFYEQGLVLGITGVCLVALLELRRGQKRAWWGACTFLNVAIYGGFTRIFSQSALYGGRTVLMLPGEEGYWSVFVPRVLEQFRLAFWDGFWATLVTGTRRGLAFLASDGNWLYLAVVAVLCCGLIWASRLTERGRRHPLTALLVGGLMALAPVTPFLVLANPWFSLRGTVPSFCGLALMVDTLWGIVAARLPKGQWVEQGTAAVLAGVFCVASVSELHDYRATWHADQQVVRTICMELNNGRGYEKQQRVGVLGMEDTFLPEQNFYYHEHIHGVTESWWALTGACACVSGNGDFPEVVPLPEAEVLYSYEQEQYRLSGLEELYLYQAGRLIPLTMEPVGEETYRLLWPDGTLYAETWEQDGVGYMQLAEN